MKVRKSNGGFTIAEMLITTAILSFAMMLLVNGSAVIQRIYRKTLAQSDAQMILSQVETVLRDDLSLATKCRTVSSGDNTVTHYWKYAYRNDVNGVSIEQEFDMQHTDDYENLSIPLYPDDPSGAKVTYDAAQGYFTVSGLRVNYTDRQGKTIEAAKEPEDLMIRALNHVDVESGN